MRVVVLVAMVLLGGCNGAPVSTGRYQLATRAGEDTVYLLDTRTGRVWVKGGSENNGSIFMPVAVMKDSSSLTHIQPHNERLLSYEPRPGWWD